MTFPAKLNGLNLAENPACELLQRLDWTAVPRELLAAGRGDERHPVKPSAAANSYVPLIGYSNASADAEGPP